MYNYAFQKRYDSKIVLMKTLNFKLASKLKLIFLNDFDVARAFLISFECPQYSNLLAHKVSGMRLFPM